MKVGDLVINKLTGNVAFVVEMWGFGGYYATLTNGEKADLLYLRVTSESR